MGYVIVWPPCADAAEADAAPPPLLFLRPPPAPVLLPGLSLVSPVEEVPCACCLYFVFVFRGPGEKRG